MLVAALLLVAFLTALSTAFFTVAQKNIRQSRFYNQRMELRQYAESGIHLGVHELNTGVNGGDGAIGTETWTGAHDVGKDGRAATGDQGEGDSRPTPGEPALSAAPMGPQDRGIAILVRTVDTAWTDVKQVISTAFNGEHEVTVGVHVRGPGSGVPGVAAVFVQPSVVLDFDGNSFHIDGNDTNPNGTAGLGAPAWGLAAETGDPPGSSASDIIDQIPTDREDQFTGHGGAPSIGEAPPADFDAVFDSFESRPHSTIASGTYSNVTWGNHLTGDYRIFYSSGDLHLSGQGTGAGVLLVDGDLTMSGQFTWVGIIMTKGDVTLTGGGAGVHIYGSLLAGDGGTGAPPVLSVSGTAEVHYSSVALTAVGRLLGYTIVHWSDLR